jgi:DNA replication protein DnaC
LITKSLIDAFGSHLFETDLSRLDPKLQQIANDYTYSERGVGFIGNSNIGKSRCIFSIVRKLALEGRSFLFLTGPQLAQTLKDTRSDDARDRHDAREMLEDARRMSLLVLDDIAQEKSSGEVLTAFWDLLNARRERKLPLFWTSNVPLAQFRARFEESKAESIITRLRDVSTVYPL